MKRFLMFLGKIRSQIVEEVDRIVLTELDADAEQRMRLERPARKGGHQGTLADPGRAHKNEMSPRSTLEKSFYFLQKMGSSGQKGKSIDFPEAFRGKPASEGSAIGQERSPQSRKVSAGCRGLDNNFS
jgi:hypothetical protein